MVRSNSPMEGWVEGREGGEGKEAGAGREREQKGLGCRYRNGGGFFLLCSLGERTRFVLGWRALSQLVRPAASAAGGSNSPPPRRR